MAKERTERNRKKLRKMSKLFSRAKRLAKKKNFIFGHHARVSRNTHTIKNEKRMKEKKDKSLESIVLKIKCNRIRDFALLIKSVKSDNPFLIGKAKELSNAINIDVNIILDLFQ